MRIRTIKPDFFLHDGLYEAERETGLPLRLSFAGIWCACDRDGRFKWEARRLGVSILPYDGIDFSRVLDALVTRGFLVKYRVNDAWFGAVPSWAKHQFVNARESESTIPDISKAQEVDASSTREARVDHALHKEGKGKEGNNLPSPSVPRKRNLLIDELAKIAGIPTEEIGSAIAKRMNVQLSIIKQSSPDVTPEEIQRRARNYVSNNPEWKLTPEALAKWWASCSSGKSVVVFPSEHQRSIWANEAAQ